MASRTRRVTIDQTARPLRLAFLVDPNEIHTVRTAIGLCTMQWGGSYNPLVPVFKRRPSWWHPPLQRASGAVSAREAADNILAAWDPDFLVDCRDEGATPQVGEGLATIAPASLLPSPGYHASEAGVSTQLIFEQFHRRLFRFLRSGGPRAVIPEAEEHVIDLAAACFGQFPSEQAARHYQSSLAAETLEVSPASLFRMFVAPLPGDEQLLWPLRVGCEGLDVYAGRPGLEELVFFLLNPSSAIDLIDFWNIRAAGHRVVPTPIAWAEEMARLWAEHWGSRSRDPIQATVSAARRLDSDSTIALQKTLAEVGGEVYLNQWLTPWGEDGESQDRRPLLVGAEKKDEIEIEGDRISFEFLGPELLDQDLRRRAASWISVIRITYGGSDTAEVFPPELGSVRELLNCWDQVQVTARDEGLVCAVEALERRANWRTPTGVDVFNLLASKRGFTPRVSEPGQVAREIVRRLGGLIGVGMLRHPALIEALERAVRSESRSVAHSEMWSAVMKARQNTARAEHLLKVLLECRVIDPGVIFRCPTCTKANWYGPDDLGLHLQCERCLNDFMFPGHDPPRRNQWAYRPRGGFASPGFAMGSYSALLSLRLLSGDIERVSWAPSVVLDDTTEIDFAMWRQRAPILSREPSEWGFVLGECKSYGEFAEEDFERMRRVGAAFPEATLVFATFRETLADREVSALREMARPRARESAPHRPNLMVLTGLELFADHLPSAWSDAGGRAAELAPEHLSGPVAEIERLADLTQQIHLGVEHFDSWRYGP